MKNETRKAKNNFNKHPEDRRDTMKNFADGMKELQRIVQKAEFENFMFIYEDPETGESKIIGGTAYDDSPFPVLLALLSTATTGIIRIAFGGRYQEVMDAFVNRVKLDFQPRG